MNGCAIRFCPLCGTPTQMLPSFGEERPTCPACGWMYFADPKVAAAVLVEQDDKVLLTRRINDPHSGRWSLPAGFVNAFEDPARAAERECFEETGLCVQVTGFLQILTGREHPRGADIFLLYRAVVTGGSLCAGDDADQVGFFSRQQLPPLAFASTYKALGLPEQPV